MPRQSRRFGPIAAMCLAVLPLTGDRAGAYPEPSVVPASWQLDFEYQKPKLIAVRSADGQLARLYAYMLYTATNRTGEDQLFVPEFTIWTDAGDLIEANRHVSPAVFQAIRRHERNPLLQSPEQIIGRLLQGRDNARDGVAIWPVPGHDVDLVRIFIAGLSGESQQVPDPLTGEPRTVRKALMIEYETPGDAAHRTQQPYVFTEQRWIMR